MILKNCEVCNKEFKTNYNSKKICNSKECYNKKFREWYKNHKLKKLCKNCGIEYEGTSKSLNCKKCEFQRKIEKKDCIIKYFCKYCNSFLFEEKTKYVCHNKKFENHEKICNHCILENRKKLSENIKGKLNPNYRFDKPIIKRETRKEMSDRMKINNPMRNKDISKKVSDTFKRKIKNGEIKYKNGKDHHLYKGNRKKSYMIRSRLKWWKSKWLLFYNYKCAECGIGGKLEIHHTIQLKNIIAKYCKNLEDLTEIEFENISEKIIKDHENIDGLVLCKKCHSKIDPFRKL